MSNGSASYAGQKLLIPVQNEFQDTVAWVRDNVKPQDFWHPTQEQWAGVTDTGRPFPLWVNPGPGSVEPGRFCWPTGATKWARGYFFVGKTELDAILASTSANVPANLILEDGLGGSITANTYVLSPIPVSQPSGSPEPCYLICLVDQRYYWQHISTGRIEVVPGTTTWADLIAACGTILGITIQVDTIEAIYGLPGPELSARYEPIGKYLDVIASILGKRVVADLDGTIRVINTSTGATRSSANAALVPTTLHSGGTYQWAATDSHTEVLNSFLPTQIQVAFPKFYAGRFINEWYTTTVASTAAGLSVTGSAGTYTYRVHAAALVNDAGTVTNTTSLGLLATQWVTDWYNWRIGSLNPGCSGIVPFVPDGRHFEIVWYYQHDRLYTKMTRAHWDVEQADPSVTFRSAPPICAEIGVGVSMEACLTRKPPPPRLCAEIAVGVSTHACFKPPSPSPLPNTGRLCVEMMVGVAVDACFDSGQSYFYGDDGAQTGDTFGSGSSLIQINKTLSTTTAFVDTIIGGTDTVLTGTLSLSNLGPASLSYKVIYKDSDGNDHPELSGPYTLLTNTQTRFDFNNATTNTDIPMVENRCLTKFELYVTKGAGAVTTYRIRGAYTK